MGGTKLGENREKAILNYKECSRIHKEKWDNKAKQRKFEVGDLVLIRRSGMCEKLSESWVGLYPIVKVNSSLSYQVNSGTCRKQVVHTETHEERKDSTLVKRVTMVLEPDTNSDSMESTYTELTVTEQ